MLYEFASNFQILINTIYYTIPGCNGFVGGSGSDGEHSSHNNNNNQSMQQQQQPQHQQHNNFYGWTNMSAATTGKIIQYSK